MELLISNVFKWGIDSMLGIEIPGIGVILTKRDNDTACDVVELSKDHLIKLKHAIDKELQESTEKEKRDD